MSSTSPILTQLNRDADAASGPAAWVAHTLVIVVALLGGIYTMFGIRDLREASEKSEAELVEFRRFAVKAARSPERDMRRVAEEFTARIREQTWYDHLETVRPRVLKTPSGLRVRFAVALPSARGGRTR